MTLQHLDNARKKFLTPLYGRHVEAGHESLISGGCIAVLRRAGECFADDVETLKDEDLPTANEALNVFSPEKVATGSADTRRVAAQCFKVIPATLKAVPDPNDCFLACGKARFALLTGTQTRQRGMYRTTSLGDGQGKGKVLRSD